MGRWRLFTIVLAGSGVGLCAPRAEAAASQPTTSTRKGRTPFDAERVRVLLRTLGSRDWQEREDATAALKQMGPEIVGTLSEAYRTARQFEVRMRIKAIAAELFQAEKFPPRKGFLGVALKIVTATRARQLGPKQVAIRVEGVIPRTAAARAGLQAGDLIVAFDGKPVPPGSDVAAFARRVSGHPPGTRVEMQVIRGNQQGQVVAVLGARPLRLERDPSVQAAVRQAWQRWWSENFEKDRSATTRPVP